MAVSITAKPLINTKYAGSTAANEYTVPASTKTIIDKFTVTNVSVSSATITLHLLPSGEVEDDEFMVIKAYSISAAATQDFTSIQNQVLSAGDIVRIVASAANSLVIRMSGREVLTT